MASRALCRAAQPTRKGAPGTFEIVGESGVSAQQLFLGSNNKVYIIDKVENNPVAVNGHPAWATEYDIETDTYRAMDIVTNTFCAGGNMLGDGSWINVGGNQPVKSGGVTHVTGDPDDPYKGLEDGSVMIIGGNQYGGFVNSEGNNNPTFEYYPSRGSPIGLPMLQRTLPANLYTLTWLMPSGLLFMQTNWGTQMFDKETNTEYPLKDVPNAVRTYPASGASVMLPMTPANNWTATILLCGGSDLQPEQWRASDPLVTYPADSSCVSMTPDVSSDWKTEETMPFGRTMGNFILLPNGKVFLVNGANTGVSGYGNESWVIGQSYADSPMTQPLIYDPELPAGSRFVSKGLSKSTIPRMYHSAATLLPDGSVFVSGSNPNADYIGPDMGYKYPTEYRVEASRFYPDYFNKHRPEPTGVPSKLTYGGSYFNLSMTAEDVGNKAESIKVVLARTGFSTHAMNMGQRMVQLENTYTVAKDGSVTVHVSQVPPNPNILTPGTAWMYVLVDGVPSIATPVMVGSGKIEKQKVLPVQQLPTSTTEKETGTHAAEGSGTGNGVKNSGSRIGVAVEVILGVSMFSLLFW
ncbi:hypothetical protein FRC06_005008 [Ceratobasidium sp. 370]|nr:hypothetical protein FRC06_005008 [Ceratobasidium sp. 370]